MVPQDTLTASLELAGLLRPAWAQITGGIPAWHPRCEGESGGEGGGEPQPGGEGEDGTDWKAMARQWERRAKTHAKERDQLTRQLGEREENAKSEQEKLLDRARDEATAAARQEAAGELRTERLHSAVARAAAGRFADVDDAIKLLDAGEDLFDQDGNVRRDELTTALDDLLDRKPHLAATGRTTGSSDAGRAQSAGAPASDMSTRIRRAAGRR